MVTSYKTGYLNFAFRKQIIKYYCLLICLLSVGHSYFPVCMHGELSVAVFIFY
jgi:hypothetical protein